MWRMLTGRAQDLVVTLAEHDDTHAHWLADYTFAATGRKVHNDVRATFAFGADGLITEHDDRFSFHAWSRQALGPAGLLLGWTPVLRAKVRKQARAGLESSARHRKKRTRRAICPSRPTRGPEAPQMTAAGRSRWHSRSSAVLVLVAGAHRCRPAPLRSRARARACAASSATPPRCPPSRSARRAARACCGSPSTRAAGRAKAPCASTRDLVKLPQGAAAHEAQALRQGREAQARLNRLAALDAVVDGGQPQPARLDRRPSAAAAASARARSTRPRPTVLKSDVTGVTVHVELPQLQFVPEAEGGRSSRGSPHPARRRPRPPARRASPPPATCSASPTARS